jgi:hypothetical protein
MVAEDHWNTTSSALSHKPQRHSACERMEMYEIRTFVIEDFGKRGRGMGITFAIELI